MKKKIFSILVILSLFVVAPVHAKDINNFYANANDTISFKDKVIGDSAIAGNLVDIIGNIDGIGFIAGNTVNVNGDIEYGFIAGNKITVNGTIEKNAYIAGNDITISSDAKINRDLFMASNTIIIEGTVNRNISLGASELIVKSTAKIGGNINVEADKITIEDGATINGTLKHNEKAKTNIGNNANIKKIEAYKEIEVENDTNDLSEALISIVNMFVVFIVFTSIFQKTCAKTKEMYEGKNKYIKNAGTGLLLLICVPVVCLLLLISSVGLSLGLVLFGLYIIGLYLAYITSSFVLGDLIITKLLKKDINNYFVGIIGIVLLKLLTLIPHIGGLISFIALILGLATIYNLIIVDEKEETKKDKVIKAEIIKKSNTKKNS